MRRWRRSGDTEASAGDSEHRASPAEPVPRRERASSAEPLGVGRRLSIGALQAGRSAAPMHGLVEIDVTETMAKRASIEPQPSITALIVASVARVVGRHPQVHRHRDWRGRVVEHTHVDVSPLVEVPTRSGPFPLATLIVDADVRSVSDITAELDRVKGEAASNRSVQVLDRVPRQLVRLPGLIRALYWYLGRTAHGRSMTGTVSVSAVGMFGRGGGVGIGPPTLYALSVIVGGMEERPRVVDGAVVIRRMLDLTVTFDHNLIDGGPATRFLAELRAALAGGDVLDSDVVRSPAPERGSAVSDPDGSRPAR